MICLLQNKKKAIIIKIKGYIYVHILISLGRLVNDCIDVIQIINY
jgi:hypothetical protein